MRPHALCPASVSASGHGSFKARYGAGLPHLGLWSSWARRAPAKPRRARAMPPGREPQSALGACPPPLPQRTPYRRPRIAREGPREQCAAFDRACAAEEAEGKRQVRFAALALAASLGLFGVWLAHVWPS